MRLSPALAVCALVVLGSVAHVEPALGQSAGNCHLDAFRTRLDRVAASLVTGEPVEAALENAHGVRFRTLDYGITAALEGCVALAGPIPSLKPDYSYYYDVPDMAFPQEGMLTGDPSKPFALPIGPGSGNTTPRFFARATVRAADGAGMNLFVPANAAEWNGKLFIAQRGSGIYDKLDAPAERDATDPFPTASGANVYLENMIDRGYAVAFLRKDAIRPGLGVTKATLDDGRVVTVSNTAHVVLALAMIEFAQREVARRLGRAPARTYYYGHSGGGITGRLINYSGANVARDGKPIVDALILDDAGNGVYLPVAWHDAMDVALSTTADRAHFVPQIDIARQLYNPVSYLPAKRMNDAILASKGFGSRHRYFEVSGTSHFDVGMVRMVAKSQEPFNYLELSGFVTALIDDVDAWIVRATPPPPSQEVTMPEVACPLGSYTAPLMANGAMTHLTPFDGTSETVTAAWRRLGLIGSDAVVSRDRYLSCIEDATNRLTRSRFLPARSAVWYRHRAETLLLTSGAKLS